MGQELRLERPEHGWVAKQIHFYKLMPKVKLPASAFMAPLLTHFLFELRILLHQDRYKLRPVGSSRQKGELFLQMLDLQLQLEHLRFRHGRHQSTDPDRKCINPVASSLSLVLVPHNVC